MVGEPVQQGAGLFAQLVFTMRREQEHRLLGTDGTGYDLGCLFDDDMGVGAASAEEVDAGATHATGAPLAGSADNT